jgi:hypothetical protein
MTDVDLFRRYAREAAYSSSKAVSENEKQALMGLACTWAQAALMSKRVVGPRFIRSLRGSHNIALVPNTLLA